MATFVFVAGVDEIPSGQGRVVRANGKEIALFNVQGRFYALDNICPHRGGPLGEGRLKGHVVTCPWHAWSFDVISGNCTVTPLADAQTFEVKVEDGQIQVAI
ncbi:MAG: nitrite reductase small subunit NirD [Acidobacteriota bacterium]